MAVGALQVAGGDVVGARVAEHHVLDALERHLLAQATDDDGQLSLVLDLLRHRGQLDGGVGPDHRGAGLEEDHRLGGHVAAHLLGVLGVVLADRDDLAGQHGREQAHLRAEELLPGVGDLTEGVRVDDAQAGVGGQVAAAGLLLDGDEVDLGLEGDAGDQHGGTLPDAYESEPARSRL